MPTPVSYQTPFSSAVDDELFGQEVLGRYVQTPTGVFGPVTGMTFNPATSSEESGYWSLYHATPSGLGKLAARDVIAVTRLKPVDGRAYLAGSGTARLYHLTTTSLTDTGNTLPTPESTAYGMVAFSLKENAYFAGGYNDTQTTRQAFARVFKVAADSTMAVLTQLPAALCLQASGKISGTAYMFGGVGSLPLPIGTGSSLSASRDILAVTGNGLLSRHTVKLSQGSFGASAAQATPYNLVDPAPVYLFGGVHTGVGIASRIESFTGTQSLLNSYSLNSPAWGSAACTLPWQGGHAAYVVGGSSTDYRSASAPLLTIQRFNGTPALLSASLDTTAYGVRPAAPVLLTGSVYQAYLTSGTAGSNLIKITTMDDQARTAVAGITLTATKTITELAAAAL